MTLMLLLKKVATSQSPIHLSNFHVIFAFHFEDMEGLPNIMDFFQLFHLIANFGRLSRVQLHQPNVSHCV